MSYKIFVSYKYADTQVFQDSGLRKNPDRGNASKKITPRDYLNALSFKLSDVAIEKWEPEGEDLSRFKDETIRSKLKDKIYDSSVTIILISPGMRDALKPESEQWIPWEVSYSLKEASRNGRTSTANALLAIVLPDRNEDYSYCVEKKTCGVNTLHFNAEFCFFIIGKNFFNNKKPDKYYCNSCKSYHYRGYNSGYIVYATWKTFIANPKKYIDKAIENREHIDDFNLCKTVSVNEKRSY